MQKLFSYIWATLLYSKVKLRKIFAFCAAIFVLNGSVCLAGGFQIPQQGIKSSGIAGAYTAICVDASSVFYNPAGMNNIYGQNFTIGGLALMPYVSVQTPSNPNTDQNFNLYTPIEFYYVGQLGNGFRVGMSINNQFGSAASYPANWEGMYIVQSISLKTYMFQPTVSYSICPKLSIGAGVVYTYATFDDTKGIPVGTQTSNNGEVDLSGIGNAFGYNVGIFSNILEKHINPFKDTTAGGGGVLAVNLGADYRSGLRISIPKGNADFSQIPMSLATQFPANENFSTSVNLPAVFSVGAAANLCLAKWKFTLTYDFNYTFWSSYDSLHVTFSGKNTPAVGYVYNYKDAMAHRIGAEVSYKSKYTLRCGYYIDGSPVQDGYISPEVVDKTNAGFTVGAGYKINKNFSVDAAYVRSDFTSNNTSWTSQGFNASYHRIVNIFGLGINYHFLTKKDDNTRGCYRWL